MIWNLRLILQPGIALWAADRLLRLARLFLPSYKTHSVPSKGTISLLTPSTIKLTLPTRMTWKAGQHFYVLLPTLSKLPFETHPFTAANIPGDSEASFIIRVRDGMTGRMKAMIDGAGTEVVEVTGRLEGPYGSAKSLKGAKGVIIFAGKSSYNTTSSRPGTHRVGGSGISFAVSNLLQIIADAKKGRSACHHVRIVWMVKSKSKFWV